MATLENKIILIVGGSSGIGFGVAKASLLILASHVIVASSSMEKVQKAVHTLENIVSTKSLPGKVTGHVVNGEDSKSIESLLANVGEVDHFIWTSGKAFSVLPTYPTENLNAMKGLFDIRFWGSAIAAQSVKIRPGGSITLTTGVTVVKPIPTWSNFVGISGAVDSLSRGLALDLAPIHVNSICLGLVDTELFHGMPNAEREKLFSLGDTLLVKHVAKADEVAEAYLFVMKCGYITGQRIVVDGGYQIQ